MKKIIKQQKELIDCMDLLLEDSSSKEIESKRLHGIANNTVFQQMQYIEKLNKELSSLEYELSGVRALNKMKDDRLAKKDLVIEMLEKQLKQQDAAIERKDKQFLGLRSAYADEIINKSL